MADKIRLGFVGANVRATWAAQSHFPALLASPDVEMTAVCTTRPESAEEARRAFGAQLAFHDYRAMMASPEIDRGGRGGEGSRALWTDQGGSGSR
jgi:predicted dehydrogenase